ncbi:ABC transporter permease [Lentibacillus jeotgali]|uniref:ABC transporter permease n=1 Tax=Lentibacillus jeotgali TaxID=558169 RepID=UPI0002628480|nr:ABC transporter permease [Lentibacillus jeotgali]
MKQIIATRLMHWKKQWISLVFWLLFPLIATVSITMVIDTLQEDAKVPVGIVLKEQTDAAEELVAEIKSAPYVRLQLLSENEALQELEKQDLDSVFVIHGGFEQNIEQDNRSGLITGYESDVSFAYLPVKEMIISHVQQETGRTKAAYAVKNLEQQYNGQEEWTLEEIKAKSKEIQQEENLLNTALTFQGTPETVNDNPRLFPVWNLWGIFSLLSTLLVFDWVIKEKQSKAIMRLAFSRWSLKSYLLQNLVLYTVVLWIINLLAAGSLYFIFGEWISPANLLSFQVLLSMAAFLFANMFNSPFYYYTMSFALALVVGVCSGALLPSAIAANWKWFDAINPLNPLLSGDYLSLWTAAVVLSSVLWFFRKEQYHA